MENIILNPYKLFNLNEVVLVSAEICHSEMIWKMRNDPITRKMSVNGKEVSWEEHSSWYKKVLLDTCTKLYVGEEGGIPIGVVRFDKYYKKKNSYKVSINISPESRRKGFGKKLLTNGIRKLLKEKENCKFIRAEVKKENESSKKLFISCGFNFVDIDSRMNNYELSL